MAMRKKLVFAAIAVSLVGIVSGLFLGGHLPPSLPIGARIFIVGIAELLALAVALKGGILTRYAGAVWVMSERNRLVFTTNAVFLVGIATGLFLGGDLLPPQAMVQQGTTPAQGANEVWLPGRNFVPSKMTVPVGTTVIWINKDNEEVHTVTSDTGLFNGPIWPGSSFNWTFTERGTFPYYCEPHPEMAGMVFVE